MDMGRRRIVRIAVALYLALASCGIALAEPELGEFVGRVTNVEGTAFILRGEEKIPAKADAPLYLHDSVRTARRASMGIMLRDDTRVSLGAKSELKLREFQFEPDENLFSMAIGLVKGTFVYVSGQIAKLAPESVRLDSPIGAIAVRGTKLLIKVAR